MKQNNLLKKVGSVVTTAAMLASLGTTGFAADNADKSFKEGNGINIKSVKVTQVANSDTLFDVEVEYEGTATNNIGVTMLTYAKHGSKLDSYEAYGDGMQIVAVDQHSNPEDKKFSFKVTTSTENENAIYMEQGNAGIVAISGDGVTGLSAAKVVIPKSTVYATKGEITDAVSISVAANAIDDTVKAAIKSAVAGKTVNLKNASNAVVGTTEVDESWINVSDAVDGVWKYTVTVPTSATVGAVDEEAPLVISEAISIADQVATVNLTSVEATKVSKFKGIALESNTATVNVSRYNFTVPDDLASELNGKEVEVIAEANEIKKEVSGVVTISIADEGGNTTFTQPTVTTDTEHIGAGTYVTTVTVKGATTNENLTISDEGLSFEVKFVVSDNTANGESSLVNGEGNVAYTWDASSVTVKSDAENKENVSKLVLGKLKADGVKVKVGYTNAADGATVQYKYITVDDDTFTFADPTAADNKIVATLNSINDIAVAEDIKFEFAYTEDTVYTDDKIAVTGTKDYTFKAEDEGETTAKANIKTLVEGLTVKVDGADLPEGATKTAEVTAYTAPTAEANGSYTAKLTLGNLVGEKWPTDKTMEVTVTGAVKAKPQLEVTAKADSGVVADGEGFKIEAAYGASVDEIKTMLATAFDVKLDGVEVADATVSATSEGATGATVGTDDITLTLTVSKGDDTVTYTVTIDAPAKANKHTTVSDVNVNVGTSKEAALSELPATVDFWVDGNESAKVTANVSWTSADYADKTAGDYDVVGTVTDVTTGRVVVVGETITVKANVNRIVADNQTATVSLRPIADADSDNAQLLEALKDTTIALGSGELAETYTVVSLAGATVNWNDGGAYNVDDSTATVVYTFADGTTTNYYNLSGKTLTITVTVKNSMTAPQAFKAENAGAYNKGNVTVYATADTAKDRTVEVKWFKYVNDTVDGTPIATSTATLAKDATEVTVATAADLTTYGLSANDQYAVKVTIDGVPLAFTSGAGTADFVYDTVAQIRVNGGGSGTVVGGGGIVGGGTTSKGDDVDNKGDENTGDVDNKGDDTQTPSTSNGGFSDVDETHWASEDIKYVTEEGLMNGTSEEEFAPEETLTRSMLVTVLYRAAGSPEVNKSIPFSDVSADSYYAAAVSWAQQNGIVNGVTESEFDPEANITREQIATIIYRYANYMGYDVSVGEDTNILSFEDAGDISEFAVEAMQYAVGAGLINGKSETTLNPQDNATRAEIAAILHRFLSANK